jgi:hypothetical protein
MRALILFIFSALALPLHLFGQQRKIIAINPGENIIENIPHDELYAYPEFRWGSLNLKRKNLPCRLNYNLLLDEIQFINDKADTLPVTDERVQMVVIDRDTFFRNEFYVKCSISFISRT